MKQNRIHILFIFILICTVLSDISAAYIKHPDVKPFIPRKMGMGDGYVVQANGLHSLWTNPAGLVNETIQHTSNDTEITIFAFNIKSQPLFSEIEDTYNNLLTFTTDSSGIADATQQLNKTGIRLSPSVYGGAVAPLKISGLNLGSFGLAASTTTDLFSYSHGTFFTVTTVAIAQTELYMGYAYAFQLGEFTINTGISVRPFFRTYNKVANSSLIEGILENDILAFYNDSEGLQGWSVGEDIGMQSKWRGLLFGLAIRDIYTPLNYTLANTQSYYKELFTTWQAVSGYTPTDIYIIPMSLNVGVGYQYTPNSYLSNYYDLLFYAELSDPIDNTNLFGSRQQDFVKHVHMGVEANILPPFFNVQLGLNQGFPTLGMGANIWLFDINYVIYTVEEGANIRERSSPGSALEIAFRW